MKISNIKLLAILLIIIGIGSLQGRTNLPIDYTVMWWLIYSIFLIIIVRGVEFKKFFIPRGPLIITLYLLWNVVCIVRGMLVAANYWEWKNLFSASLVMLLPFLVYFVSNHLIVKYLLNFWLQTGLILFLFLFAFIFDDGSGRYLAPVSVLLLFLPAISFQWRVILLGFSLFIFLGDLDARSNVIKFAVPILLSLGLYTNFYNHKRIVEVLRITLMLTPIVLFILAANNSFNVFHLNDYIKGSYNVQETVDGRIVESSLTADTRTPLYTEVITSAIKNNYILWGRTPAKGNDSKLFGIRMHEVFGTSAQRFSNEVSILNIFTWTGIIGVALYMYIFYRATFLAVCRSNNRYSRLLGIYIAFRWCYAWVEDFNVFDLSYVLLWMCIGLCYSKSFRNITNAEMRIWIRSIFKKRRQKISLSPNIAVA